MDRFSCRRWVAGVALAGAAALALPACATLSKKQCQQANWTTIGERDGLAGKSLKIFDAHVSSCEGIVTPDRNAWQIGYVKGVRRYCTPENGLQVGAYGLTVSAACPKDQVRGFSVAYKLGYQHYRLASLWKDNTARLKEIGEELDEIRDRLVNKSIHVDDARWRIESLDYERERLRRELRDADFEFDRLADDIRRAGFEPPTRPLYSRY